MMFRILLLLLGVLMVYLIFFRRTESHPPLPSVPKVDLDRFMGDWYVIANIPTFVEKGAIDAIEHYERKPDGSIFIRFTYEKEGSSERKQLTATGFVVPDGTGANWRVQFIWPIKMPYQVIALADDYSHCVVGVPNREYLWIMARTPKMQDSAYNELVTLVTSLGFDPGLIQRVPQNWPDSTSTTLSQLTD